MTQTTPEQAFEEFMQSEQKFYDLKICPFCKSENPSNPVCKTERSFLLAEVSMPEMREMLEGQAYGTPAYIAFDLHGRSFVYPLVYAKLIGHKKHFCRVRFAAMQLYSTLGILMNACA